MKVEEGRREGEKERRREGEKAERKKGGEEERRREGEKEHIILVDQVYKIYWNGHFHLTREIFFFTLLPHMHMRAFPSLPLVKVVQTCEGLLVFC